MAFQGPAPPPTLTTSQGVNSLMETGGLDFSRPMEITYVRPGCHRTCPRPSRLGDCWLWGVKQYTIAEIWILNSSMSFASSNNAKKGDKMKERRGTGAGIQFCLTLWDHAESVKASVSLPVSARMDWIVLKPLSQREVWCAHQNAYRAWMERIRENRKSETKAYSKMAALRNFTRREKKLGANGGNKVQKKF